MLDLAHLTLRTDQTRVVTFQWDNEPSGLGDGQGDHHEYSHQHGDPKLLSGLARVDRFYISRLSRFLNRLREDAPGGERLLDSTAVLYGSGMSNGIAGGHSPENLPLILAGGKSLGLSHGRHLRYFGRSGPTSNLLLTFGRRTGADLSRFADSNGELRGLM